VIFQKHWLLAAATLIYTNHISFPLRLNTVPTEIYFSHTGKNTTLLALENSNSMGNNNAKITGIFLKLEHLKSQGVHFGSKESGQ